MCCSVLQCVAEVHDVISVLQSVAECCGVLQCAAVCCSVLQCDAEVHDVISVDILFCRISSLLKGSFAKETYNFNEWKVCVYVIFKL